MRSIDSATTIARLDDLGLIEALRAIYRRGGGGHEDIATAQYLLSRLD
jgi:hypothetical protein